MNSSMSYDTVDKYEGSRVACLKQKYFSIFFAGGPCSCKKLDSLLVWKLLIGFKASEES